jgi:hypothetical protein
VVAAVNGYAAVLALLGLGLGAGLLITARAIHGTEPPARPRRFVARPRHVGRRAAVAGAAGLLAGALTGWVIGALLAAMAAWSLPSLLRIGGTEDRTAQVAAIAGWTEMLRDTLAAAAGLEQTILATAPGAPEAIRPQVTDLAARLESGQRLPTALRDLAEELADPTADLVIAALILAAGHEARQVAALLGELAATARSQVEMYQRVEAGRARTLTTLRVVVGTTLTFAGGLILLNPGFLSPYDSAAGQLVLLLIGAMFAAAFAWLRRMARIDEPERFFTELDPVGAVPGGVRQEAI